MHILAEGLRLLQLEVPVGIRLEEQTVVAVLGLGIGATKPVQTTIDTRVLIIQARLGRQLTLE